MGSLSGLGIGLSFVFGCILMGLVAELYYLLWWKKRLNGNNTSNSIEVMEEVSFLFCWRRRIASFNSSTHQLTASVSHSQEDLETGSMSNKDNKAYGEGGVETELMRMHNLCGPPRFLFTIKEESKEDLESEDGRSKSSRKGSRTNKSLSEIVFPVDANGTPFLTPLSSPTVKTPHSLDSYSSHGFNPLFESVSEAELNKLRSSPPPKFKFLKDAEDKLIRRLLMEEAERKKTEIDEVGSFIKFIDSKSLVRDHHQVHNQATQVLPLASSPEFHQVFDKSPVK